MKIKKEYTSIKKEDIQKDIKSIFKPKQINNLILSRFNTTIEYIADHKSKSGKISNNRDIVIIDEIENKFQRRFYHQTNINLSENVKNKSIPEIHEFIKSELDTSLKAVHKLHYDKHRDLKIKEKYIEYKINDKWYIYDSEKNTTKQMTDNDLIEILEDNYYEMEMRRNP